MAVISSLFLKRPSKIVGCTSVQQRLIFVVILTLKTWKTQLMFSIPSLYCNLKYLMRIKDHYVILNNTKRRDWLTKNKINNIQKYENKDQVMVRDEEHVWLLISTFLLLTTNHFNQFSVYIFLIVISNFCVTEGVIYQK